MKLAAPTTSWSVATLLVWLLTHSLAPVVALHVALEHDEHAASHSSEHHDESAPADHDGSDHHHAQIAVGLAQTAARPQAVAPSVAPPLRLACGAVTFSGPSHPDWLDSLGPTRSFAFRSPVLLL